MFGLDRHVSMQCVDYKACSCVCSHTKRRKSAHFLSYEVISMRNVKHDTMFVTKFPIDKSKRCTTTWLNLRTLLSMQFFTILKIFKFFEIWSTNPNVQLKTCWHIRVHVFLTKTYLYPSFVIWDSCLYHVLSHYFDWREYLYTTFDIQGSVFEQ